MDRAGRRTHSRTVGSVRQGTAAVCLAPSDRRVLQTLVRGACSAVGENDGESANAIAVTEKLCSSMKIARIAGTAGRPAQPVTNLLPAFFCCRATRHLD